MFDSVTFLTGFSFVISSISVLIWFSFLVLNIKSMSNHEERRPMMFAMPIVGLLTSLGTLASVSAFLYITHVEPTTPPILALIAAIGRGALLMGGVVGLMYYLRRHG